MRGRDKCRARPRFLEIDMSISVQCDGCKSSLALKSTAIDTEGNIELNIEKCGQCYDNTFEKALTQGHDEGFTEAQEQADGHEAGMP